MSVFLRRPLRSMPRLTAALTIVLITGCTDGNDLADAYGNFEATEVLVSAAATGRILFLDVVEGQDVMEGSVVGIVDTVQFALQRSQLRATRTAVLSRIRGVEAEAAVLTEQRRVANREYERLGRLAADQAATQKQLDDVEGQLAVLDRQIERARTQLSTIRAEAAALDAQIAQVQDHIAQARIENPVAGTVLAKYAESREMTAYGKPLYKVADLSTMELRAYVSGAQLPNVRLGQEVEVRVDRDRGESTSLDGRVSWIASEAEFTPKLIQTKEERVNLVYAFKVRVANADGLLKIGMPGEVWFRSQQ